MKGLLMRRVYGLKNPFSIAVFPVMLLLITVLMIISNYDEEVKTVDPGIIMTALITVIAVTGLFFISLQDDRKKGFEKYCMISPVSHTGYYMSSFILYNLLCIVLSALTLGTMFITVSALNIPTDSKTVWFMIITTTAVSLIFTNLMLMAVLALGTISKVILFLLFFGLFAAVSIVFNEYPEAQQQIFKLISETDTGMLVLIEAGTAVVMIAIITVISIALYKRKEL